MPRRLLLVLALFFVSAAGLNISRDEANGVHHEFTFARLIYSGGDWLRSNWAVDYPKADKQFLQALRSATDFSFVNEENVTVAVDSPQLFDYPFVYAVEVGYMNLSKADAFNLREYLLRGGFLVVDDFHGEYEWNHFENQMRKVLPEFQIEDLPISHPIFHCYFDIEELFQVPGLQFVYSGRTWEKGGFEAHFRGIRNDQGRLMVMINHNVDLGDAWEWAEQEAYPRHYANLAFQLGINYIIYSMTH